MSIKKTSFALVIMVSICVSQNINISGNVIDSGGIGIEGADVRLEKVGLSTTTDNDGRFTITGTSGINDQLNQSIPYKLSVKINNGFIFITIAEKSPVEIITYNLQGRVLSTLKTTIEAGTNSITLPDIACGVYLYTVKSGNDEFVLKRPSVASVSSSIELRPVDLNTTASSRMSNRYAPIDDVISVMKDGYLNYRVIVTNSDTSNIEIKMIVRADTVRDIDGNLYDAVRLGNQVWTVENLRTTKYNDGTPIPLITTDISAWLDDTLGACCYYNNTTNADSIKKLGALYNWYAIDTKKIAPEGWHIPDTTDWFTLEKYLIANGYNWDGTTDSNKVAKSLAAQTDWFIDSTNGAIGNILAKNNKSGFSTLPSGYRSNFGDFYYIGKIGFWWGASEYDEFHAYTHSLSYDESSLNRDFSYKKCGYSVRLVRD